MGNNCAKSDRFARLWASPCAAGGWACRAPNGAGVPAAAIYLCVLVVGHQLNTFVHVIVLNRVNKTCSTHYSLVTQQQKTQAPESGAAVSSLRNCSWNTSCTDTCRIRDGISVSQHILYAVQTDVQHSIQACHIVFTHLPQSIQPVDWHANPAERLHPMRSATA